MFIAIALIAFGLLIAFHELGHMWVAKRMGMRVDRFSIGFGPSLFSWRRGETEYVLSALPLGGYVKIAGMSPEDEIDPDDTASYANKPAWKRLLVIAAGPFANYLIAFVLGIGLLMSSNREYDFHSTKIGAIDAGMPAEKAGLRIGDTIDSVGGTVVTEWAPMRAAIAAAAKANAEAPIPVGITRGTEKLTLQVVAKDGVFGIAPTERSIPPESFPSAVVDSAHNAYAQSALTATTIYSWIVGSQKVTLSGPIGIVDFTAKQAKKGLSSFLETVWSISISIGFFNLLPIPALDGGRVTLLMYELVARRRVNRRVEDIALVVGIIALIGLMVFASYGDIMARIRPG